MLRAGRCLFGAGVRSGRGGAGRCAVAAAAAAAARGIVNNKILRPGYNFLLPGVRSEPSKPMIRKVFNELLRSMDTLNIRSIDGPTGLAGCAGHRNHANLSFAHSPTPT